MREAVDRARPEVDLPPRRPDRRAQVGRPTPRSDARVNVRGTINCSRPRSTAGVRRVVNTSTGGAIYGEGQILPAPEDHPVGARGALRPVEVLRRGLLRPVHAPARPVDRLAALRQRLRAAPGPARRGRRDRDLLRQAARGRAADDLRRRPADARLRLRRRRRRRQPGAAGLRATGAFNVGRGVADDRARPRRGARASSRTTASRRSSRRRGRARCSTSRSTPRAPGPSSAGRPGSTWSRGSRVRSTRCAEAPRYLAAMTHPTVLAPGEGETLRPGFEIKVALTRARGHRGGLRAGRPRARSARPPRPRRLLLRARGSARVAHRAGSRAARRVGRNLRVGPARRAAHVPQPRPRRYAIPEPARPRPRVRALPARRLSRVRPALPAGGQRH